MMISDDQYYLALMEAAQNPNTLPSTLDRWAEHEDFFIRVAVAANPNTSFSTLVTIARGTDKALAKLAHNALNESVADNYGMAA